MGCKRFYIAHMQGGNGGRGFYTISLFDLHASAFALYLRWTLMKFKNRRDILSFKNLQKYYIYREPCFKIISAKNTILNYVICLTKIILVYDPPGQF